MSKVILNVPLNRVEGDLEIRVTFEGQEVVDAQSIGTLYRGFENMLKDRAPMDALVITPRICGICSITHLTAAVKAIESASNITPPPQAVRMRNLSLLAETVQNDLRQVFLMFMGDFAHQHYANHSFYDLAKKLYEPLKGTGCIAALRASKDIVKVIAIIGGQWPHTSHMVPGGVCTIPTIIDMTMVAGHINQVALWYEEDVLGGSISKFEQAVTCRDTLAEWVHKYPSTHLATFLHICKEAKLDCYGKSHQNFISYGCVDDPHNPNQTLISSGILQKETGVQQLNTSLITEDLSHAWYQQKDILQHPSEGKTKPDRSNKNAYTWAKAPRYHEESMQTGPIAQALIDQEPIISSLFEEQGDTAFVRELARLLRPARHLKHLKKQVNDVLSNFGEPNYIKPQDILSGSGCGLIEAARGALGHWITIKHGKISNYQIITPTAWNASPLDCKKQHGPWEQALLGLRVKDIENPMEIGHVIRSFDPCLVCTVHALGTSSPKQRWTYSII